MTIKAIIRNKMLIQPKNKQNNYYICKLNLIELEWSLSIAIPKRSNVIGILF